MARQSDGPWFRGAKDTWYATVGGDQVSLGVRGKGNRKAALRAWHELMANGREDRAEKTRAAPLTVAEVVTGFLADVEPRAKSKTLEVYRYFLTGFSKAHGDMPAGDLRPFAVERYSRKPTWGLSTRHDFIGTVVSAFRWAERAGVIDRNPLTHVRKPPKASRGAKVVLTGDEFARLSGCTSAAFGRFLRGLWLTGARPGELTRVTAGEVDFPNGVAVLDAHKTAEKTGRPRVVYLAPDAVALFQEQARVNPSGPLFRNSHGGVWTEDAIVTAMKKARRKAGLPQAVAYGMRHSFATAALVNGVPDAHVAALLGHTNTGMVHKHYAHVSSQAAVLRQAAAAVRASPAPAPEPPT